MDKILEMFVGHTDYIVLTLIVTVAAIALTFIVNFVAKSLNFIKYLPGLVLIFTGMFFLFSVLNDLFEKASLDSLIISVVSITAGLVSLLFALIIGIINSDRKAKR